MIRKTFNEQWNLEVKGEGSFSLPAYFQDVGGKNIVDLPHDAMILGKRSPKSKRANNTGFYPGGIYTYTKSFFVPEENNRMNMFIEFEGVYMNAMVFINGDFAATHPYGYSNFYVSLDKFLNYGAKNEIKVIAKCPSEPDSRWYSGGGIYRNVKIITGEQFHIKLDGVKIRTRYIEEGLAALDISTEIENTGSVLQDACIETIIHDASGNAVASCKSKVTATAGDSIVIRHRIQIDAPQLWSPDHPNLYFCSSHLVSGGVCIDEDRHSFGIRTLQLDRRHGLRINGEALKLRGGCIHHDNGVLGAGTFERAEERRAEILKKAGFNALRSAHHPMSKAMLDACDRVGLLVLDEAFDMWNIAKSDFDYSLSFDDWWERDTAAMVAKDFNHPCVIMYSIGNEIPETGSRHGAAFGRKIAEKIRSLDPDRFVTVCVNGVLSSMYRIDDLMASLPDDEKENNNAMNSVLDLMLKFMNHPLVTELTEESFAAVDIAGYNYMTDRYESDRKLFPNRIMMGSESFPPELATIWKHVKSNPQLIGDFSWTAWDYIGESGVGKSDYTLADEMGLYGPYPWYLAYCGDIDIIGNRRPGSYWREIVWGLRRQPYIAVQRPQHYGQEVSTTSWSFSDAISSWSWPESIGKPVKVEVYSSDQEVELLCNGVSLGRMSAGEQNGFKAIFDTVYSPGVLTAVSYTNGTESERFSLETASDNIVLSVDCDRKVLKRSCGDLAYIMISLMDQEGRLNTFARKKVRVDVSGCGVLQGFGSADPLSLENFFDLERTTYDGKVLAVVRPGRQAGKASVKISTDGCSSVLLDIIVE
jgi:beta-galactosidase